MLEKGLIVSCIHFLVRNDFLIYWYLLQGLMLKNEELERVKKLGIKKLLHRKKLHLLVDLDHTLLHSADSGEDCLQSQTDGPQGL